MTAPARPAAGRQGHGFGEISKEALLNVLAAIWRSSEALPIAYEERVEAIERQDGVFDVAPRAGAHRADGAARDRPARHAAQARRAGRGRWRKVVYRLIDPEQYAGQRVLVVGGGDSALEAAASLAEETDAKVTLSYRGEAFARAKPRNRERAARAVEAVRLDLRFNTEVVAIAPDHVRLVQDGAAKAIHNDAVIICAGGVLPTELLATAGIALETKWGEV